MLPARRHGLAGRARRARRFVIALSRCIDDVALRDVGDISQRKG
jgi:hypothetical protein